MQLYLLQCCHPPFHSVVCQATETEDRSNHEEEESVLLEGGEETLPPPESGAVELFVGSAEVRHVNNVYNGCMAGTGNSPFSWCSLIVLTQTWSQLEQSGANWSGTK